VAKKPRLESEVVIEARRRLLDGLPDDALVAELVRAKRVSTPAEAKKIVARARRSYRAEIGYDELAERCFELYESAREAGDARGALLALRQWEKWTGLVMRHTMASVAAAEQEQVESELVRLMLEGRLQSNVVAQIRAACRRDEEAKQEAAPDALACSDEEALAIALGRRR